MSGDDDPLVAVLSRSRALGFLGPGPVEAHIEHAAAFAAAVSRPPARLLDLGTGGGVPGLALAARWPSTTVTLLDAQERRTAFLADAVAGLGWEARVAVVTGRAEVVGRDERHRGAYDVVTARSFGPPAVTAECGAPFLAPGGVLVVAEPPGAPPGRWPAAGLEALGLEDGGVVRTGTAGVRRLRLTGTVPDRYPRRDGLPARRPLF